MKAEQYINPLSDERYDKNKKDAYICDLDGTLSIINDRHPYDGHLCETDLCHEPLADILSALQHCGFSIILLSGRMEKAREATECWLKEHDVDYDELIMRATDDYRADDVIKEELYREHVEPEYNVMAIFDDRPRVIRMWRRLGLLVFDCGDGEEF